MKGNEIFIVHGHDDVAKLETARTVEQLGLKVIILDEQANGGRTIIEKIEKYTNVGFAIVLYTPCDTGSEQGGTPRDRARQNVVLEHGYLMGKLGRSNVMALVKGDIETPSDIAGVVYTPMDGGWKSKLVKELQAAGYSVDANILH